MAIISSIQIDTKSASKSIADLEKELQETNEQLKNVDINSDAFDQLQKKAADAKGQLDRINQTTDAMSKGFQGFGENLAKVTGGISGGITAATAAFQLLGVENENVTEGIAKLQQLMAFTQGISALKDLGSGFKGVTAAVKVVTKSFHGLKGAIAATGIGALVVVLGLVIENWDKIVAWMNKFVDVSKIANTAIAGMSAAWEGLKQTIAALGETITTAIVTPFQTITAAIKAFSDTEGSAIDKLKAAVVASKDTIVENGKGMVDAYKEVGTKAADAFHDSLLKQEKKNAVKRAKASVEAYLKAYGEEQQRLADSSAFQEMIEGGRGRGVQRSQAPEAPDVEREVEEDDGWADNLTEAQNYYNSLFDLELGSDAQFNAIQDEKRKKLEEFYKQGLISAEQYNKAIAELDKKERLHKVQMYSQAATGIADILDSLASAMDESNEKQFKAMKAMQIASATIQMMVGITTALSGTFTTKTGPWDIALAVIQATSIAASGAAQIANIARQQYNGDSSSSSASTATASLSSAATSITTPEQYSSAVEGVNIEESVGDTRVYVLESDIQNTSNRVSVQETENRY